MTVTTLEAPAEPALKTSYDVVPYTSHPFAQTDPRRLYAIARMFGLKPTPPARGRRQDQAEPGSTDHRHRDGRQVDGLKPGQGKP